MANNIRTRRALTSIALASATMLVLVGTAWAGSPSRARGAGELRDLQLATVEPDNPNIQPTDLATAQVVATELDGQTTVTLKVQGLDHAAASRCWALWYTRVVAGSLWLDRCCRRRGSGR